ncbi:MAG: transketolase, partial [Elusimicrobia bacterium]|nr:transketolase [Elusimicrobiota bacterium]
MPIINSKTGNIVKEYSLDEIAEKAKLMRAYSMVAITAAGSGHPGGTLSIMDLAAVLYFKTAKHDPENPDWLGRDRIFWSAGHKAPALYASLGATGYFPIDEMVKLRKLGSGFEGHPNKLKLPGVEISTGSLGHGLGIAVGSALNALQRKLDYRVFCIMGDGEHNEGSVWEAAMCAAHYKLDNLVAIVDLNKLQIDGPTDEVMCLGSLKAKYEAFGWEAIEINGHDLEEIVAAFEKAETVKGRPTAIIADTIKGKCVSYAENVVGYHGVSPKDGICGCESLETALEDIEYDMSSEEIDRLMKIASDYQDKVDEKIKTQLPKFSKNYWWNSAENMKAQMDPTRMGFGRALEEVGADEEIVAHGADITSSIKMDQFNKNHPDRDDRFFSVGIAEQNMIQVACGFANENRIPFVGSYGVFVTGRAWDQIRTSACYNQLNLKIADAHAGITVGPDGATHQSLEEIALMAYLPGMTVTVPCDSEQTYKMTKFLTYRPGPA